VHLKLPHWPPALPSWLPQLGGRLAVPVVIALSMPLTNRWARQRAGEASKFAGAMMTQRVVGKHGGDDDNVRRYSRGLHAVLKTTSVCCYSERGSSKWDRLRPFITH
jgi:hypothetical protein